MRNLTNVIFVVLLLIALAIVVFVSTLIFVGIGYGLSCILPLSLFQGALLSIGTAFVLVLSISAIAIARLISRQTELEYMTTTMKTWMENSMIMIRMTTLRTCTTDIA